ncbi:MAG: hypothetical protein NTV51_14725 [Verrucomicrobia bacterium]|nr:hypothetical protein [Verrucomicrobiota bacterium]
MKSSKKNSPKSAPKKNSRKKGTVSWNDLALVECSDSGAVSYGLKLHVRLPVSKNKAVAQLLRLADPANRPANATIAGIIDDAITNPLFRERKIMHDKYECGEIDGWTFRLYCDGNEDAGQSGYFVEFEFRQSLRDEAERKLVRAYLKNKSDAAARAAMTKVVPIVDEAAKLVLEL